MSTTPFDQTVLRFAELELRAVGNRTVKEDAEWENLQLEAREILFLAFIDGIRAAKNILVGSISPSGLGNLFHETFGNAQPEGESGIIWMLYLSAILNKRRIAPASVEAMQRDLALFYLRLWQHDIKPVPSETSNAQEAAILSVLCKPVEELNLSVRGRNVLKGDAYDIRPDSPIRFIGDLVQQTEAQILQRGYCGRKTLREYKDVLGEQGLLLHTSFEPYIKSAYDDWRARQLTQP